MKWKIVYAVGYGCCCCRLVRSFIHSRSHILVPLSKRLSDRMRNKQIKKLHTHTKHTQQIGSSLSIYMYMYVYVQDRVRLFSTMPFFSHQNKNCTCIQQHQQEQYARLIFTLSAQRVCVCVHQIKYIFVWHLIRLKCTHLIRNATHCGMYVLQTIQTYITSMHSFIHSLIHTSQ